METKIPDAELRRGLTETESLSLFIAREEGLLRGGRSSRCMRKSDGSHFYCVYVLHCDATSLHHATVFEDKKSNS